MKNIKLLKNLSALWVALSITLSCIEWSNLWWYLPILLNFYASVKVNNRIEHHASK